MVPKTNAVPLGGRKKKIERLPEDAWSEVHPVGDTGNRRPWEWACLELAADPKKGMSRWLLPRQGSYDPEDLAFYQAYGLEDTSVEELVRSCQERWAIEVAFEEAKALSTKAIYVTADRGFRNPQTTLVQNASQCPLKVRSGLISR